MELTKELIDKAKEAKSAEELIALAKENGEELTKEEAERYFAQLHQTGELTDEELDNVSGGGCGKGKWQTICPYCKQKKLEFYDYYVYVCQSCRNVFRMDIVNPCPNCGCCSRAYYFVNGIKGTGICDNCGKIW